MIFKAILPSLIFGILALCTMPCFGVFSDMEIWNNDTQRVYLLKDCHIDYSEGKITINQQADLVEIAQKFQKEGVCMIVEDSISYCGINKKIRACFDAFQAKAIEQAIKNRKDACTEPPKENEILLHLTPLACLTQEGLRKGIPTYNVESNHAITMYTRRADMPTYLRINRQEVVAEFEFHMNELSTNPLLKEQYAIHLKLLDALKKIISLKNNEKEFIEKILAIRFFLADAKTIHRLVHCRDIKHIFICQGAMHIEQIKPFLQFLGYKQIKNMGKETCKILPTKKISLAQLNQKILEDALDLKTIFAQLMNEQHKDALKDPSNDPLFLATEQGQKWLKETAGMADNAQPAAAAGAGAGASSCAKTTNDKGTVASQPVAMTDDTQ